MIRKNERFLSNVYMLFDVISIQIAFLFSWFFRFYLLPDENTIPFSDYFYWSLLYSLVTLFIGYSLMFYSSKRKKTFAFEFYKIIQIHLISTFVFVTILFIFRSVDISRWFLLIFFISNIIFGSLYRVSVKLALRKVRENGFNKKYILIIGAGKLGIQFYNNIKSNLGIGYEILGFLDDSSKKDEVLGKVSDLETIIHRHLIDEVVIALPLYAHDKLNYIINTCENSGIRVLIIPDYYKILPARPSFDQFGDIPVINIREVPLDEFQQMLFKRVFDIGFALVAIILTLPIMLIIALAVKITSPGPVIFKQERVGLNRRNFMMYKFRSMKQLPTNTVDAGWSTKNDPRRTWFGSFIRKTSLDELPQFFNVLKGDMSVVGPRPERPYFVDKFKEDIPKYMIKHHVRPGITGWAQVNGLRGDTSIEDRIKHDIFYIENWTFLFDMRIILKTFVSGLVNRNAY